MNPAGEASEHDQARWEALLARPEDLVPLDEACLLVSARLQVGAAISVGDQQRRLDALAEQVPEASTDGVVGHLFRSGRFRGNTDDYTDPANSYLDRVLDRRLGIPISLAVLAVEVGRRVGVALHGVGLPGHFLLGVRSEPDRFIDVFSGGVELDAEACRHLYEAGFGAGPPFDPAWLEPVGTFAVLSRVLANLKNSFTARGGLRPLAEALTLRSAVPGVSASERLELGDVLTALGRFVEAAGCYEQVADLVESSGDDPDGRASALRSRATAARARLN